MAAVDIFDVKVLDNPAPFKNPLQFEITYDVRETLEQGTSTLHLMQVTPFLLTPTHCSVYTPTNSSNRLRLPASTLRHRMEGHLRRLSRRPNARPRIRRRATSG